MEVGAIGPFLTARRGRELGGNAYGKRLFGPKEKIIRPDSISQRQNSCFSCENCHGWQVAMEASDISAKKGIFWGSDEALTRLPQEVIKPLPRPFLIIPGSRSMLGAVVLCHEHIPTAYKTLPLVTECHECIQPSRCYWSSATVSSGGVSKASS